MRSMRGGPAGFPEGPAIRDKLPLQPTAPHESSDTPRPSHALRFARLSMGRAYAQDHPAEQIAIARRGDAHKAADAVREVRALGTFASLSLVQRKRIRDDLRLGRQRKAQPRHDAAAAVQKAVIDQIGRGFDANAGDIAAAADAKGHSDLSV